MVRVAAQEGVLEDLPVVFRFSEALASGVPEGRLRRWVTAGLVERLGRGVYRRAGAGVVDPDRVEVALRAPRATVCLVSALVEHELIDDNPGWLDVALPRGQWRPQVASVVRWHSFAVDTFDVGRGEVPVGGGAVIGLYEPRRCLVDVFRLRHEVGPEVGVEALRRWLRRPGSQPGQLLEMARTFPKAAPSLTAALQVLL